MLLLKHFLLASGLTGLVAGASVKGRIHAGDVLPDASLRELTASTRVVLDGGRWSARVGKGGEWEIQDVDDGDYLLDVISPGYLFDQLLVRIHDSPEPSVHHHPAFSPLYPPAAVKLPYPLHLTPTSSREFVAKDQGFAGQLRGMVGNPMMLMMLGSAAMIFVMPKILSNIDPEAGKEAQVQKVAADVRERLVQGPARPQAIEGPARPSSGQGGGRAGKAKRRR